MPAGLDWPAIAAVTPLKGIGFTIAIFISALAFDDVASQDQAKLAILFASAAAAAIGLTALYLRAALLQPPATADARSRDELRERAVPRDDA